MTVILGISAFYHDSAAAILVDGEIVAAAQEERFSRIKHDSSFPTQAIEFCLKRSGVEIEQIDHVAFYEKPFLKFERILETHVAFAPKGLRSFLKSMPIWLKSKLYISRSIRAGLGNRYRKRIVFLEHHESHASAFFASPFDQAAILTIDAAGEWATATTGVGMGNRIELRSQLTFPDSLGLLYSAFTYFCGFRVNGGEGKLMGLAPYGEPIHVDAILQRLIDLKEDGSFRLDPTYFDFCVGRTMTSRKFDDLFGGPPRVPESPIGKREQDLAASIQAVTELILLKMAAHLHRETGMENLCIAGGVGLNCVANGRLIRESPFENVWVAPAPGDAGAAIGAALFVWYQLCKNTRNQTAMDPMPFFGLDAVSADIDLMLTTANAAYRKFECESSLDEAVVELIERQKVVGWFQGPMEFGPRALGNRSILADPRSSEMQSRLNQKIKFRESFRPFAPAILIERCHEYFEWDRQSRCMQFTAPVKANGHLPVPAVTHVDGTARIQTVSESDNPRLYRLLQRFEMSTGCPMLVNTSFNVRGEPMVCHPRDAYRCFMKTDMDVLVIGNSLLLKSEQSPIQASNDRAPSAISLWRRLPGIWSTITFPLRWLVSTVALTIVFLCCITPIGIAWRWKRRDSFVSIDRESKTYWRLRPPPIDDSARYFKQY